MSMYVILIVVKLLDLVGAIIACLLILLVRKKWMIPVAGAITSIAVMIIVGSMGSGIHPDLIMPNLVAGIVAFSVHALIFYYVMDFFRKRRDKKTSA